MSSPLTPFADDQTGSAVPMVGLGVADQVVQVVARATAAGLPLAQAVAAYSAELPSGRTRRALRSLSHALDGGTPLEVAVREVRPRLPDYAGGLMQAAMESGQLGLVLEQHLRSARRTRDLRFRFWASLTYPLVMLALAIVVAGAMLTVFVPQFEEIFKDFGVPLPFLTKVTIEISALLVWLLPGWPLLVAFMVIVGVAIYGMRFLPGRPWRVRQWQRVPLFGWAARSIAMSEFCGLLMLLVECGVPLPKALRLTAGAVRDANLAQGSLKLAEQCEHGLPPDQEVAYLPNFPDSLAPLFRWEGRPDALASGLQAAAELYAAQARIRTWVAGSFIQPIVLGAVVFIVGGAVFTMFLPLFALLDSLT
jgi:type II secretory pathway component PulF